MENAYQSSTVQHQQQRSTQLDDLASGQKLVVYAVLAYLATAFLRGMPGPLLLLPLLAMLALSWVGLFRISRGLEHPLWGRVLLLLLTLVPLVGLLVLVMMSTRATARLRAAGYSVGLLGVRYY